MDTPSDAGTRPKSLALGKMELLVRRMQSQDSGVPVRCQKLFLTTIPSAFMGYDLVEWLMENQPIDDSAEALHLSSLLCQHGYFFPVGDVKVLQVKDDSSLYRFQTPYYWPSRNHVPDSTDYAIYLNKRGAKNKQKHGLDEYETEALNQLKKSLASKWDFVSMQSEEQAKMAKDRKKGDKIVSDSQERAYWRVYRPPPGIVNTLELPIVPPPSRPVAAKPETVEYLQKQVKFLQQAVCRTRQKNSQVYAALIANYETYCEFDPYLSPVLPSNPWLTDDPTFMELNEPIVECPTEQRVRRWAISIYETIFDPTGLAELTNFMRKEFSHENIRFWTAVHQLKKSKLKDVDAIVKSIYNEFLRPGAPCEINIDGRTMEVTQERLKKPTRTSYDCAAEHILVILLKKDCFPRFVRSEFYKNILTNAVNPTSKKRFFAFAAPGKKKISSISPPNPTQLMSGASAMVARPVADDVAGADQPYREEEDAGIFLGDSGVCAPSSGPPKAPAVAVRKSEPLGPVAPTVGQVKVSVVGDVEPAPNSSTSSVCAVACSVSSVVAVPSISVSVACSGEGAAACSSSAPTASPATASPGSQAQVGASPASSQGSGTVVAAASLAGRAASKPEQGAFNVVASDRGQTADSTSAAKQVVDDVAVKEEEAASDDVASRVSSGSSRADKKSSAAPTSSLDALVSANVSLGAPLGVIVEQNEEPAAAVVTPQTTPRRRTEIVTLTDSCAQTIETGDDPIYNTTDQQCEANLGGEKQRQGGARRKEKRVKISDMPPTVSSDVQQKPVEQPKREKRACAKEQKKEAKKEKQKDERAPRAKKEGRKKAVAKDTRGGITGIIHLLEPDTRDDSIELDDSKTVSGAVADVTGTADKCTDAADIAARNAGDLVEVDTQAPSCSPSDSVVHPASASSASCPWDNKDNCEMDTTYVKKYATLGYL